MLIIKTLMVGGSILLFSYFFIAARGRPVEKLGMSLVFLGIAYFALFPLVADRVANFVGVDRGADLMLYLSTMALLFLCFNLYLRQKQLQSDLLAVVRTLGLLTAQEPGGRGHSSVDDVARNRNPSEAPAE
jgi:hypothetical protein